MLAHRPVGRSASLSAQSNGGSPELMHAGSSAVEAFAVLHGGSRSARASQAQSSAGRMSVRLRMTAIPSIDLSSARQYAASRASPPLGWRASRKLPSKEWRSRARSRAGVVAATGGGGGGEGGGERSSSGAAARPSIASCAGLRRRRASDTGILPRRSLVQLAETFAGPLDSLRRFQLVHSVSSTALTASGSERRSVPAGGARGGGGDRIGHARWFRASTWRGARGRWPRAPP